MKTTILSAVCGMLFLLAGTNQAQAQNPSFANRSVAALNDCAQPYRQGNNFTIDAVLAFQGFCEINDSTIGLRLVYDVYATPVCRAEICPALAPILVGTVSWCASEFESAVCALPQPQ